MERAIVMGLLRGLTVGLFLLLLLGGLADLSRGMLGGAAALALAALVLRWALCWRGWLRE